MSVNVMSCIVTSDILVPPSDVDTPHANSKLNIPLLACMVDIIITFKDFIPRTILVR